MKVLPDDMAVANCPPCLTAQPKTGGRAGTCWEELLHDACDGPPFESNELGEAGA